MWAQPQEMQGPSWGQSSVPGPHLTQDKLGPVGGGLALG